MSSALTIQTPFIVASLPRPMNHPTGRYVVSDVHNVVPGSRKRKRAELAVGIDGEGLNIYSTRSSKLTTTYALPPQAVFTCPPCSLRLKKANKRRPERRTYISLKDTTLQLRLFRDLIKADGTTESTILTQVIPGSQEAAVFLGNISNEELNSSDDLLLVKKDGEIQCFNGEDLKIKWTSPASAVMRHTELPDILHCNVEFASITDASTASKGLLKERPDIFSAFPHAVTSTGFNPSCLILLTSPTDSVTSSHRTLQILTPNRPIINNTSSGISSLQTLLAVRLPWLHTKPREKLGEITYYVHESSGVLYELADGVLRAYDVAGALPKLISQLFVNNADSFLRLNETSIATSSMESLDIYNPVFQSLQASILLDADKRGAVGRKRKFTEEHAVPCKLIAYSSAQSALYAIIDNNLTAFPIEHPIGRSGNDRPLGLLIDSLGRGVRNSKIHNMKFRRIPLKSFGDYLPGSKFSREEFEEKISELDRCVAEDDVEIFDALMMPNLGILFDGTSVVSSGKLTENGTSSANENGEKPSPVFLWPNRRSDYREVDHRWIQYALSRIFTWSNRHHNGHVHDLLIEGKHELQIEFSPHNVINWLLETGNMTRTNIESSLKHDTSKAIPPITPGQLVKALVEADPEMKMLLSLLSNTYLDASELLHAIRLLMRSLEIFGDGPTSALALLTNGDAADLQDGDVEAEIEHEEAEAQAALQLAEYQLEEGSNIRGQALSLALSKLNSHPSTSIVKGLQSHFSSKEIVSLVYLLRFELARGEWTSRYLDSASLANSTTEEDEELENNTINLISNLLNTCIDAIGSGGWLSGNSIGNSSDDIFDSEELISSLKLEVSAALEGIEEATYLKGLVTEIVRYGEAMQKGMPRTSSSVAVPGSGFGDIARKAKNRPISLPDVGREANILPVGLKAEQQISLWKIGAGGEISRRTMRDIGRLKSRKVGKYSLERIII